MAKWGEDEIKVLSRPIVASFARTGTAIPNLVRRILLTGTLMTEKLFQRFEIATKQPNGQTTRSCLSSKPNSNTLSEEWNSSSRSFSCNSSVSWLKQLDSCHRFGSTDSQPRITRRTRKQKIGPKHEYRPWMGKPKNTLKSLAFVDRTTFSSACTNGSRLARSRAS